MQFKRLEIGISVQKRMPPVDAKRRDEAIDRLADGSALRPERAIVAGGCLRQVDSACGHDFEALQRRGHSRYVCFVVHALQNLTDTQIQHTKALLCQFGLQPPHLGRACAPEVVNPDARVHNDHGRLPRTRNPATAAFIQVAAPSDRAK